MRSDAGLSIVPSPSAVSGILVCQHTLAQHYKVLYGRHGMADQARNHKESGYHSLVALVLAMQADAFVITSGSNWSRLMEELCLGKDLEPRCPIVDVTPWRPHDW